MSRIAEADRPTLLSTTRLASPVYRASDRLQILPIHTAAAVIEVKASLNAATLKDGYAKIHSCKALKSEPMRSVDRSATQAPFDSLGLLGVIFAFSSELTLKTLAEHAVELNKEYHSDHWPDLIVVLDRGFIDYGVSPPGTGMPVLRFGPRAPAAEHALSPPPLYVQMLVEEVGESTLNHFFLMLLSHLTFFPVRAGLPHFDVLTGGGREKPPLMLTAYQFDLAEVLRPTPPEMYADAGSPSPHMDVMDQTGKLIGRASLARWQDAAYVWWQGLIPLDPILKAVLPDTKRVQILRHTGHEKVFLSSLLSLTEQEFRSWPEILSRRSNLRGKIVDA
jgi:hypothetical protein